jgi:plastocyanin
MMQMSNKILIYLITILIYSSFINAQTLHNITVADFSFTPSNITITGGDQVKWTNVLGTHNVRADNNSFFSGPAAPAPWEFTHTFTTAGSFRYYCEPHGGPGGTGMSGIVNVMDPVGVPEEELIAKKFELSQNFPNPFNPSTKINFVIPTESFVTLKVYDLLGNTIATLMNEVKSVGNYEVEFNADNLSSGTYIYQLRAGEFIETKKMTLLR